MSNRRCLKTITFCNSCGMTNLNSQCIKNSNLLFHAPHLLLECCDEGSALRFLQNPFGALETKRKPFRDSQQVCVFVCLFTFMCVEHLM